VGAIKNQVSLFVSAIQLFEIEHLKHGTATVPPAYIYQAFNCLKRFPDSGIELPLFILH
jgi:hypothetical protein